MKTQGLMKSKLIVKLEKLIGDVTLKELKTPSQSISCRELKILHSTQKSLSSSLLMKKKHFCQLKGDVPFWKHVSEKF